VFVTFSSVFISVNQYCKGPCGEVLSSCNIAPYKYVFMSVTYLRWNYFVLAGMSVVLLISFKRECLCDILSVVHK
jgi:hypothetical protein